MKKSLFVLGLGLFLTTFTVPSFGGITNLDAYSAVAIHGSLRVVGSKILDKNNEPVCLAGNSFFWSNNGWGGERYYNSNVVAWLKKDWGATVVRAALGVEGWGNYIDYPEDNKARIQRVVEAAIAEGLYVIIDWHTDHAENWPSEAVSFFQEMATNYGQYDNVIYEIYNEPLDISWADVVKPYAESVISAIRAIDPDNLIVVGTPEWSQRVDLAAADPITGYSNIVYTLHFYTVNQKEWLRERASQAMRDGIALFVTEWGSLGYTQDDPETELWMQWCRANDISHCNWAVNDKTEEWSALQPDANTNGYWSNSELTDSGLLAKRIITNWVRMPTPIPSTIQAENYDLGGEGVGYHDIDGTNTGTKYRWDGVDIEANAVGCFNLGWLDEGEWLRFTVRAAATCTNLVRFKVGSGQNLQFCMRLTLDDATVDVQTFKTTDGWWVWTNLYSSTPFVIDAGVHTVKVHFVRGGFNFDELEFLEYTNDRPVYRDPSVPVSNRVSDLLSRMTLDEKIGQMCQVNFPLLSKSDSDEADIRDYCLGALLSGAGDCPMNLNGDKTNTVGAWVDMTDRFQGFAMATRLAIPLLYGVDAVHGHNNLYGATIFPHNIGLGAAHNPDLVRRAAQVTAVEVAATGIRWTFAPCVAVPRSEYWGRFYEGFGETAELAADNGVAAIEGFQGSDLASPTNILACAKHFVGDGGTAWGTGVSGGIDRGNTVLDETAFRALHLEPYRAAIDAGVMSVMAGYQSWNGVKMHANTYLLTDVLKGELGFQGFVVSDWAGIDDIDSGNYTNCVVTSINAGLDMIMVPGEYENFLRILKQSVTDGLISTNRIDDAVRRILHVKFQLGLFERPYADRSLLDRVGSPEHRSVAREAVRQSCVVLKNENGILPLRKDMARIHVAGKNAADLGSQCGGWTIDWQGATGDIVIGTTILDAITSTVCPTTVVTFSESGTGAAGADACIVVVGETPYAEFYGDTQDLSLSSADAAVIQNVKTQGVPVVTVLISGRPLIVQPQLTNMAALVAAWLPGTEGQGVADVLFGDYYPHSFLPHSWLRDAAQGPINIGDATYDPLYPLADAERLDPSVALLKESGALSFTWAHNHEGFVLQSCTSLVGTIVWSDVPGAPAVTDDTYRINVDMPVERQAYYRLRRP